MTATQQTTDFRRGDRVRVTISQRWAGALGVVRGVDSSGMVRVKIDDGPLVWFLARVLAEVVS